MPLHAVLDITHCRLVYRISPLEMVMKLLFSDDLRYAKLSVSAGSMRPTHSPKPTSASSFLPHTPRMVISSPSSRNVLFSPPSSSIAFFPLSLCSRKLPYSVGLLPLIVPDPSRSPGWNGQPVIVWCASICGKDHRRFRALTFDIVVVLPDDANHNQYLRL
jgi:hypothetical protein